MNQEPPAPAWWRALTREHWLVFAVASLAWLFDCLDQQLFNLARDGAMEDLMATKALATEYGPYTTSVFLVGWAIGGLIFGSLGDRFGRIRMLTWTILLYSVCTGLGAFSTSFVSFCVYRFLTGMGVGGVFGLAVALVADAVPDRSRAPALGLLQSLSSWGNISAGLIGMVVGRAVLPFELRPWQAMFLVGAFPALLCALTIGRLREPEKWTAARAAGARQGIKFGSYGSLLSHPTWRKNAWLGLAVCSAGIIGLWGIGNFHPKIVRAVIEEHLAGSTLAPAALAQEKAFWSSLGLVLQNVGGFCGMLFLSKLSQTWGRRPALAVGLTLSFLTTVLVFKFLRELDQMYWMLPLMGFGQYSVFGVYAIVLPELFPTSLRSTGASFCYNFGRFAAASAPFTIAQITRRLGSDIEGFRSAGVQVSFVLLLGLIVLPFLPETRGKPLPTD
jgi:MFS family permease